jgi:hypothetical protein
VVNIHFLIIAFGSCIEIKKILVHYILYLFAHRCERMCCFSLLFLQNAYYV